MSRVATFSTLERTAKSTFVPPEWGRSRRCRDSRKCTRPPPSSSFSSRLRQLSRLRRLGKFRVKTTCFNQRDPVRRRRQYRPCCSVHPSLAAHQLVFAIRVPAQCQNHGLLYFSRRPLVSNAVRPRRGPHVSTRLPFARRFRHLNPSVPSVCVAFTPRRHRSICAIIRSEYRNFVARPTIVVWFEHGSSTRTHVYTYCFRPSVRRRANPSSRSLPLIVLLYCVVISTTFATRILSHASTRFPPALYRASVSAVTFKCCRLCRVLRRDNGYASADCNFARAGLFWFHPDASTPSSTTERKHAVSSTTFAIFDGSTSVADANSCSLTVVPGQQLHHHLITCYQPQRIRSYTRALFVIVCYRHRVFDAFCIIILFVLFAVFDAHYILFSPIGL